MWEQYETPEERQARPAEPQPAFDPSEFRAPPVRAAGQGSGVGIAVGLVGMLAVVAIGVGMAGAADDPALDDGSVTCWPGDQSADELCQDDVLDDLDDGGDSGYPDGYDEVGP